MIKLSSHVAAINIGVILGLTRLNYHNTRTMDAEHFSSPAPNFPKKRCG
jgi:hypothetical protein